MPPSPKPKSCIGCPLYQIGTGYAKPEGPRDSRIAFIGESLGRDEVAQSRYFVGMAGGILNRLLYRNGISREDVRIANLVSCQPPNNELAKRPWTSGALEHCKRNREAGLANADVVVTLGGLPTRILLDTPAKGSQITNWHGTVNPLGSRTIIPTFHPAFIGRAGNMKYLEVASFDLRVAQMVEAGTWEPESASLVVDPDSHWFSEWVSHITPETWLAVDIETPEKLSGADEDALKDDPSFVILRVNFSYNREEGVTVPWKREYIPSIRRALESQATKLFWNERFDLPRIKAKHIKVGGFIVDLMWYWHVLQSNLRMTLGFVAPFYSGYGAWKHLSGENPGLYAAIDAVQTWRIGHKLIPQLKEAGQEFKEGGQLEVAKRHVTLIDRRVTGPAEEIGLLVDPELLQKFHVELQEKKDLYTEKIAEIVPEKVLLLHPKKGWASRKKDPIFVVNYKRGEEKLPVTYTQGDIIEESRKLDLSRCLTCGKEGIVKSHKCKVGEPQLEAYQEVSTRYFVREPFNPDSADQIRAYMAHKGIEGKKGKGAKTDKVTTEKKFLKRMIKRDPIFKLILDNRAVSKVLSTYVIGTEKRLDSENRLHASFLHRPSTLRFSCVGPNLQNVVADREDSPAAGFRYCIIAADGCTLVEIDYSAIEAVLVGWFMKDPDYIRLARLGVHAYLASHLLKRPADLSWPDSKIAAYFRELKHTEKAIYKRAKKCVHSTNYGQTPHGIAEDAPEVFTLKTARETQGLLFNICPGLKAWHKDLVREWQEENGSRYLGLKRHPYLYRHWFNDVFRTPTKRGDDSNKIIAFYPQSTAAGVLKESNLEMTDPESPYYIGDAYYGKTPIRALIHDSDLLEVPDEVLHETIRRAVAAMTKPVEALPCPPEWGLGSHLSIGVEVKVGKNWGEMEDYQVTEGVAGDRVVEVEEEVE